METVLTGALVLTGCASSLHFFGVRLDVDPNINLNKYSALTGISYGLSVSICLVRIWS